MLPIITPLEAAQRKAGDQSYIVDFYWRGCPVVTRIANGISENSCGALRSLRFTWNRPKSAASTETVFINHTLAAVLDAAKQLAGSSFTSLHVEKVKGMNDLFALAQFENGIAAEIELNECLPLTVPDTCFIKANFTNGHITNQPLIGHFNEDGSILATDESLQTIICENDDINLTHSVIEQMLYRFKIMAENGNIPAGDQGAMEIINLIKNTISR